MRYNTLKPRGIREWNEKKYALKLYFHKTSIFELCKEVMYGGKDLPGNSYGIITSCAGSLKSYNDKKPNPSDPGRVGQIFFTSLEERLNKDFEPFGSSVNMTMFFDEPYSEFYFSVPEKLRSKFPKPRNGHVPIDPTTSSDQIHYAMLMPRGAKFETVREGLDRGRIDQKFYYLTPESAQHWLEVVDSPEYPQYEECKAALECFLQDKVWQEFITSKNFGGIVLLGAGAASKDISIIESALSNKSKNENEPALYYTLIDFSNNMLHASFQEVDASLTDSGQKPKVNLRPLVRDFMDLSGTTEIIRPSGKNVAWFILGGTIGNINEEEFIQSIRREARAGDLFIIGAETVGAETRETMRDLLVSKYKNTAVRNFVMAPLRAAWHDLQIGGDISRAFDKILVDVTVGKENIHSAVPRAATVELSVMSSAKGFAAFMHRVMGAPRLQESKDNRKIVLLTSTRYDEIELVRFVARRGFQLQETVTSPLNSLYKQFVFSLLPSGKI